MILDDFDLVFIIKLKSSFFDLACAHTYVCVHVFFIMWYPRACACYGILGSVLVPARRAVGFLILSGDFGY